MKKLKSKSVILRILRLVGKIILWILGIIGIFIAIIIFALLIGTIQEKLFLPSEYIMLIAKYPYNLFILIFDYYIFFGASYAFRKDFRIWVNSLKSHLKKYSRPFLFIFATLNLVLLYTIICNVTVITNNKIINYTFLSPQGKEYKYNDIVKIETGVYGNKQPHLPFAHYTTGDFYYTIQLNDGTKIDLTDTGGPHNADNIELNDPHFIIERLDREYVNMGIPKVSSMDNFEECTKNLDKIYTEKIQNILLNKK